jgi:hypothetical protein
MKHFTIVFGLVLVTSSAAAQLPGPSACAGCSVAPVMPDGGRSQTYSPDQPVFAPGQPISAPVDPPIDETNIQPPTPEQRKAAIRSVCDDPNFGPRNRGIGICDGN